MGTATTLAATADESSSGPTCRWSLAGAMRPKLTDAWLNLSADLRLADHEPSGRRAARRGANVRVAPASAWKCSRFPATPADTWFMSGKAPGPGWCWGATCCLPAASAALIFPTAVSSNWPKVFTRKLFTLPDDTLVLPGHGPATTIGEEKQTNPFVGARRGGGPERPA